MTDTETDNTLALLSEVAETFVDAIKDTAMNFNLGGVAVVVIDHTGELSAVRLASRVSEQHFAKALASCAVQLDPTIGEVVTVQ